MTDDELFYVLDIRSTVGNCALWWCPNGQGYTCELDKAGKYIAEEVRAMRETDIAVPCAVAEAAAIRHVRVDAPALQVIVAKARSAMPKPKRSRR